MMVEVSKITVKEDLKGAVREVVEVLGGFGRFVEAGETVFLKPNFNTADPFPASSDPVFLRAVAELVSEAGAKRVILGESSTMSANTRQVMERLGIFALEEMTPSVEVVNFDEGKWVKKVIPKGRYLRNVQVSEILDQVDKLILLPCLKTHRWAQFTGALKLSVGFMKPLERAPLHARKLQEKIAELNLVIDPALVIMDARKCFITRGPEAGELREPGLILASTDRVALDIKGIKIIQSFPGNSLAGINPSELPQIKRAIELGLGVIS